MKMMTIASGSSGNCTYVGSENTGILVDVGVSKKKILDALQDVDRTFADINGIVITHEHIDHIRGLGVISRAYGIPIYATEATIEEIKYTTSLGTLDYGLFHSIQPDEPFMVGNIEILAHRRGMMRPIRSATACCVMAGRLPLRPIWEDMMVI